MLERLADGNTQATFTDAMGFDPLVGTNYNLEIVKTTPGGTVTQALTFYVRTDTFSDSVVKDAILRFLGLPGATVLQAAATLKWYGVPSEQVDRIYQDMPSFPTGTSAAYYRQAPSVAAVQAGTSFAMTANVAATPAISGLTASTAYKIYFVAKDIANNVQVAVQNVAVTTTAAASLPAGYVGQGGLTWTPNNVGPWSSHMPTGTRQTPTATRRRSTAKTGWRLPTLTELSDLYSSGATNGQGWNINATWTSTAGGASHYNASPARSTGPGTSQPKWATRNPRIPGTAP